MDVNTTPQWTKGYRTDQEYAFGLFPHFEPRLASALRGFARCKAISSDFVRWQNGYTWIGVL
jgi:hypothetical protein